MNLTAGIVNLKHAHVMRQLQIRVARRLLDVQEQQGAAMVSLIAAAGNVATSAGDALVVAATGLGATLDMYA